MYIILFKLGESSLGWLASWGYGGMLVLSMLDRVSIALIPAEVLLPLYGFLVGQGVFYLWSTFAVISIGGVLGEVLLFLIFMRGGRLFMERYGKYFLVSKHDLAHLDRLFIKYGNQLVFWGRFLPVARAIVAIPAGLARMPLGRFTLYSFLGMMPYNFLLVLLGDKFGEHSVVINSYISRLDKIGTVLLLLFIAWYIYRHLRKSHLTHE